MVNTIFLPQLSYIRIMKGSVIIRVNALRYAKAANNVTMNKMATTTRIAFFRTTASTHFSVTLCDSKDPHTTS